MAPLETLQHISNESFSRSWSMNSKPAKDAAAAESAAGVRPSLDIIPDGSGGRGSTSFIDMDPKSISMRRRTDSFEFGRPSARPSVLVHADEIISNGLLLPLHFVTPTKSDVVASSSASNSTVHPALMRSLSVDSSKPFLSRSNQFRSGRRCPAPCKAEASSLDGPHVMSSVQCFAASSCGSASSKTMLVEGSYGKKKPALLGGCAKSCKMLFRKYAFFLSPLTKKVNELAAATRRREDGRHAWCCMASIGTSPMRKRRANAYSRSESCCSKVVDAGTEKAILDAVLHCKNSFSKS